MTRKRREASGIREFPPPSIDATESETAEHYLSDAITTGRVES